MTKTAVTVLGLGAMGRALAEATLAAGHPTTVWNRSADKAADLVDRGAVRAATVAEAVGAAPVVIACVLDQPVLCEILDPAADALAGRALVNLTNGTPDEARRMAEWVAGHGADYLDGGIMAVPPMIGEPGALILYSGSREVFDRHRTVLDVLAEGDHLGADPGLAALYDLALLGGMYGMFAGARHAAALVATVGGDPVRFVEQRLVPWLNAVMPALSGSAEAGDPADSPVAMQRIAIANIIRASREQGLPADLLAHLLAPIAPPTDPQITDDVRRLADLTIG
ncbi:6-phosphogluconate dehydrogenase [Spongiactinospora gelatinilytica]|uniref:6-phosphogluconate dehydrogenase n=1 Tax=Spongiactinospora gelatinilytica TaxID=2666298 RepID=A0A2W2GPF9_9ACTN|nr:NAD(P)-binding domain-containing protein [Spongiactinospora gelatinilytica]PZG49752.1 6-phosphogluconate dehydrogenase [Spongiactinospora gelatinilytica]